MFVVSVSVPRLPGVSCHVSEHVPGHNENWPLLLCPLPCTVQCLPTCLNITGSGADRHVAMFDNVFVIEYPERAY